MNNCKKTIKQSDISTTQIKLKYSASYYSSDTLPQFPTCPNDIYGYKTVASSANGLYGPYNTLDLGGSVGAFQDTAVLLYRSIKQRYYQNYLTGSLNNSASCWDWNAQSTACSGSSEYEYRYFPTGSTPTTTVGFITIATKKFGEQISRNSFTMKPQTPNNYLIKDDGNGNLIDTINNNKHVGNIIYAHGMIIITNADYVDILITS
jgi:hypothetical protein